jgi:hypothetical protein
MIKLVPAFRDTPAIATGALSDALPAVGRNKSHP